MTFDFASFFERKATWSLKTFGPEQRPAGVIAHIRKELVELQAAIAGGKPSAILEELADVCLLAIDLSWRTGGCAADFLPSIEGARHGISASEALKYLHADLEWSGDSPRVGAVVLWDSATRAIGPAFDAVIEAKFAEVQKRTWPDRRMVPDDQPIEHIRADAERTHGEGSS